MRKSHHESRHAAAGFTLVEVLVAVVVLCIGLLGIAKMSLTSVQSNNSAYMRSQAMVLIQEIVDDMHANSVAATTGLAYNIAIGTTAANPGIACTTTSCPVGASAAAYDLWVWKQRLSAAAGGTLPNGDGSILVTQNTINGQNEYTAVVTVQWTDSVAAAALGTSTTTQTLSVETLL